MNTIGIIVAMDKELNLLLPLIEDRSEVTVNDFTFVTGTLGGRSVAVGKCGIGKVNAAVGALSLIDTFHPSLVINTGVAGGTGSDVRILDVVLASEVAYHDVWCGPGTIPGQAAGCPPRFECPLPAAEIAARIGARTGLLASGDIFVSRPEDIRRILELYPRAVAVDMESGAIAQVCHLKNVPFICLRVLSDTPGEHEDNIAQYENFWTDAPERTFHALEALLGIL